MDLAAIVLAEDVAVDPRKYGDLLAPVLGVTRLEAKIAARRGRGLLVEDIDLRDAERLVKELAGDGIAARAVRNEDLPRLGAPRKATSFERTDQALRWRGPAETEWLDLPWARIDVVSLGVVAGPGFPDVFAHVPFEQVPGLHRVDDPADRELIRENLIARMRTGPRPARPRPGDASIFEELQRDHSKHARMLLDLVDTAGPLWLRASMDVAAYAAGPGQIRLGESWAFDALTRELRARRPGAFTAVSLKFVPGADIKDLAFLLPEEFARYTAWHAVCRHLGMKTCANAGSSSP